MSDIATIFAPAVAAHLVHSVLFLAGIAVALVAVENVRRIRARYGYIKLRRATQQHTSQLASHAARGNEPPCGRHHDVRCRPFFSQQYQHRRST